MSWLRGTIELVNRRSRAGLPLPPTTLPALHHAVAQLAPVMGDVEPAARLKPFLIAVSKIDIKNLHRSDLNRVLRGCWIYEEFDEFGSKAVERAWHEARRSSDSAIIDGYLLHFPVDRPVIHLLAEAARIAATRHVWVWQKRNERWQLFKPEIGPVTVASELLRTEIKTVPDFLNEVGVGSNFTKSRFGIAAFESACQKTAKLKSAKAQIAQTTLLCLLKEMPTLPARASVVRALLEPWMHASPEKEHRQTITDLLVNKIGDPRVRATRWDDVRRELAENLDVERIEALIGTLKRWLVDDDMRLFFSVIDRTTDNRNQWRERQEFWLAYLDAGLVQDAWPALGERAESTLDQMVAADGRKVECGWLLRSPKGSSALILQIGDVRIAEWSDNGACRFWHVSDKQAPKLYVDTYHNADVRTTAGRDDFEYKAHQGSWQPKFAYIIYRRTNVSHPLYGRGSLY